MSSGPPPQVKLNVNAPPVGERHRHVPGHSVARQRSRAVDSKDARVRVTLSDGATLSRSEPPPNRQDERGGLIFDLPPVSGKGKQEVTLQVKPATLGQRRPSPRRPSPPTGCRRDTSATTRIEQGNCNSARSAAAGARRRAHPGSGLGHQRRRGPGGQRHRLGAVRSRGCLQLRRRARSNSRPARSRPGRRRRSTSAESRKPPGATACGHAPPATATSTAAADPVAVDVRRAELAAAITGPKLAYLEPAVRLTDQRRQPRRRDRHERGRPRDPSAGG